MYQKCGIVVCCPATEGRTLSLLIQAMRTHKRTWPQLFWQRRIQSRPVVCAKGEHLGFNSQEQAPAMKSDLGMIRGVWMEEDSHVQMCLLNSALLPQVYLKQDTLVERHWGCWPGSHNEPLQDPSGSITHSWKGFIGW